MTTYHIPIGEYAKYPSFIGAIGHGAERIARRYEWWFPDRAGTVIVPSEDAERRLVDEVGVKAEIVVLSSDTDVERFGPAEDDDSRCHYDLGNGPFIDHTGHHGYERHLDGLVQAVVNLSATLTFGDDGPARDELSALTDDLGVDAHFLGFPDHEELSVSYSAFDVFCFPSPVETQGLVVLEVNVCRTSVVGVNENVFESTVPDGVTGCHYKSGDLDESRHGIWRALAEREELSVRRLDRRNEMNVDRFIDRLAVLYDRLASE